MSSGGYRANDSPFGEGLGAGAILTIKAARAGASSPVTVTLSIQEAEGKRGPVSGVLDGADGLV